MDVLAWGIIGYVAGMLPSAYLVAALRGQMGALAGARREDGGGDAHVLLRVNAGMVSAVAATTADVLKALIPTFIAARVVGPYAAAACLIGAVAGHCWPPIYRRYAGRGMAAAGGGFLVLLPVEMAVAGILTLVGTFAKVGGPLSLIGFLSVPFLATLRGQPPPFRLAAWAVIAMMLARRLEGISGDIAGGATWGQAVFTRLVIDAPPRHRSDTPS